MKLIYVSAIKGIKKRRKVVYSDFSDRYYYINPEQVSYIDTVDHIIHLKDGTTFKVWYSQFDNMMKEIKK